MRLFSGFIITSLSGPVFPWTMPVLLAPRIRTFALDFYFSV